MAISSYISAEEQKRAQRIGAASEPLYQDMRAGKYDFPGGDEQLLADLRAAWAAAESSDA